MPVTKKQHSTVVTRFGNRSKKLLSWFTRHDWAVRIDHHTPYLFATPAPQSRSDITRNGFSIHVSAPERAILELLHLTTTNDAVNSAIDVMSDLSTPLYIRQAKLLLRCLPAPNALPVALP